ncbi:MAG: restriction endonuclease [Bacteroidota bacterium]|nr:restriction endonuclease [Bacteroidota bacterium]
MNLFQNHFKKAVKFSLRLLGIYLVLGVLVFEYGSIFNNNFLTLKEVIIKTSIIFFVLVVFSLSYPYLQSFLKSSEKKGTNFIENNNYSKHKRLVDPINEKIKLNNSKIIKFIKEINYTKLDYLRNVDPFEFEKIISDMYKKLGYKTKLTSKSNDKGFDIVMTKDNIKYLVECKRYSESNLIGRELIQKFFAAVYNERAEKGFFVTTSDFRKTSLQYIKGLDEKIELINNQKLLSLLELAYPNKMPLTEYKQICDICGLEVNFCYPNDKIKECANGHTVSTKIEMLIKNANNATNIV